MRHQQHASAYTYEDSKNRVARSISVLCKFIEDFEGVKSLVKGDLPVDEKDIFKLSINNQVSGS